MPLSFHRFVSVFLVATLPISCNNDDNYQGPCRLSSLIADGRTLNLNYDSHNRVQSHNLPWTGSCLQMVYEYDDQGRLTKKQLQCNGIAMETAIISYPAVGITQVIEENSVSSIYYSGTKIDSVVIDHLATPAERWYFVYTGDNLERATIFLSEDRRLEIYNIEYDKNRNPNELLRLQSGGNRARFEMTSLLSFNPSFFSRNNPIRYEYSDYFYASDGRKIIRIHLVQEFEYSYNASGYPSQEFHDGNTQGFSYQGC